MKKSSNTFAREKKLCREYIKCSNKNYNINNKRLALIGLNNNRVTKMSDKFELYN